MSQKPTGVSDNTSASPAVLSSEAPPPHPPDHFSHVANQIEEIPAADGALVLQRISSEKAADVAEYLDPVTASRILSEMDPTLAASVISDMEAPEASMVLAEMDPDDRVDILEHVPAPMHDAVVAEMPALEAEEVRQLEQYAPDSAGGIMTTEVTSLYEYLNVDDAISLLREMSATLEQMFYVYVIDRRQHLVGVLSMRDLILARPETPINRVMIQNVRSVPATMDQEEVAQIFRKYNYLAMPVVNSGNKLLGIITVDDVVDVLQDEATEDVQRMFGAGAEERLNTPWQLSFRKRVWWLEVNLATAFLAAAVVGAFEGTIQKLAILAAYMPVVAGMGGNASAQAMAVAIRGIAVGKVDRRVLRHVITREFMVGLLSGLVIGLTTAIISFSFHYHEVGPGRCIALGAVVATALIINQTIACVSGAGIPFVMKRLGFDPAQSATIFATTVTDVVGFFSLLGLAYVFMDWLI